MPGLHALAGHPGRQPPAGPSSGQVLQPGLGNVPEADRCALAADPQPAQLPGVAGILSVPAGALGQVFQDLAGVAEQPPVPGGHRGAVQARAENRYGFRLPQEPDGAADFPGPYSDRLVVTTALQRVLQFQLQRRRQPAQVDLLMGGQSGPEARGPGQPLVHAGPAMADPGTMVDAAERSLGLRPDGAAGHRALPAPAGRGQAGRQRIEPAVDPGPARHDPVPGVTVAQVHGRDAVPAAGHPAVQQAGPGELRCRRRGELLQRRPAAAAPASFMAEAQSPAAGRAAAAAHHAGGAPEYRVGGVEGQHVSPELRAHHGHQFFQQAARDPVLPGLCGVRPPEGAHRLSCPSSKTDAAMLTATPPRTPRACR